MQTVPGAPVAFTLPSAALPARLAWIRQVTARSLASHQLKGTTLYLTYRLDAKADLERIVAGEQECCSFLSFDIQATADSVRLTIGAPEGLGSDARWLFDQFLPAPQPPAQKGCGCAPGACG